MIPRENSPLFNRSQVVIAGSASANFELHRSASRPSEMGRSQSQLARDHIKHNTKQVKSAIFDVDDEIAML
jgi:hypothetical protein